MKYFLQNVSLLKGLLRILLLTFWGSVCGIFAISVFMQVNPLNMRSSILLAISIFIYGFYFLPSVLIILADTVRLPAEQRYDMSDYPMTFIHGLSIGAGVLSFVLFMLIRPICLGSSAGSYMATFIVPYIFIIGNYVLVTWLIEGFRNGNN